VRSIASSAWCTCVVPVVLVAYPERGRSRERRGCVYNILCVRAVPSSLPRPSNVIPMHENRFVVRADGET